MSHIIQDKNINEILHTMSLIVASNGSPRMRIITSPPFVRKVAAACIAPAGPVGREVVTISVYCCY